MYSIENIDGKESNTAKGINIASLMNSKTFSSTRKEWDIKWEEFKPRTISLEHTKITKYLYHALMTKYLF